MYGLVNKAVEDLVVSRFGEEAWEKIRNKAGVSETFISMDSYPDQITYSLVGAATEVLQIPADKILEAFGEYWVLYTGQGGYGDILAMSGDNLSEFLQNLDMMHTRVGQLMPQLQPPSFMCTEITHNSLNLHYFSERQGLTPMVFGLLRGLGKKFNTEVSVELVENRSEGADHDVFAITWKN